MKSRLSLGIALINNPDIILADEPSGALDSKTSVQIMELLLEIAKEKESLAKEIQENTSQE